MNTMTAAPMVLLWGAPGTSAEREIAEEFEILVRSAFSAVYPMSLLDAEFGSLDDARVADAVECVLRAPRAIRRLLWPSRERTVRTIDFLRDSLRVELMVRGDTRFTAGGWTADGRAFVSRRGQLRAQPRLEGCALVIDLASPHALTLDLDGGAEPLAVPRSRMTPGDARRTFEQLAAAWRLIGAVSSATTDRLQRWIRVVVAQTDPRGTFWSGSNGHYIGRAALTNAGSARVSVAEVADALVHEGIHGFLSEHETLRPWVTDPALFTDRPAIRSPWTRNMLPVRPYLQACFVWYGLAMFWASAMDSPAADPAESARLFARAAQGFILGDLEAELAPWRAVIDGDIVDTVAQMQAIVRELVK